MQPRHAPASSPEQLHARFAEVFNAGDLDGIVALYEPDAVFAPEPGKTVTGRAAIAEAYRAFLSMRPRIEMKTLGILSMSEGIALAYGRWSIKGKAEDGSPVEMAGRDTEIMRRQPNGGWLFAIDNPFSPE
jgi:uncharacterized protein (TIGR02246 family)